MLGDGFLDPFGFYGRPMIIDPSTYIASLTHILFLANFAADQVDAVVTSTGRFPQYSVRSTGDRAFKTVGARSMFARQTIFV